MSLTIESARNGFVIRDNDTDQILTISDTDPVEAALAMLREVNEQIGEIGGRYDEARIRILAMPGDKWLPRKRGECRHPWVERREYGGTTTWRCFCGAEFAQVTPGDSWEDELARTASGSTVNVASSDPEVPQAESGRPGGGGEL